MNKMETNYKKSDLSLKDSRIFKTSNTSKMILEKLPTIGKGFKAQALNENMMYLKFINNWWLLLNVPCLRQYCQIQISLLTGKRSHWVDWNNKVGRTSTWRMSSSVRSHFITRQTWQTCNSQVNLTIVSSTMTIYWAETSNSCRWSHTTQV